MRNEDNLFGTKKGLLSILIAILVIGSFLGIPRSLQGYSGEAEELYFCILHTNDIHSALIPHSPAIDYDADKEDPTAGGFARLATAVAGIRENKAREGEPVLLFDAGDFLGGAPFAWLALRGYAAELTIMQKMGYDAVAIGNHEYDYGPDILAQYLSQAGYPEAHEETLVLASNTEAPADHPLAAHNLYRKNGILELENGLKVGVFALIGKDAIRSTGDTGDVQFLDQHEVARQMVAELKQQGADVIVAISHSGVDEDRELARKVPGIDVIVGGHSHTSLYKPVLQGGTVIVQAGCWGIFLGQLELAYNPNTGKVRVRNEENSHPFLVRIDDSFAPDPEIDALVQEYTGALNAYVSEMTHGRFSDIMTTVARSDFALSADPPSSETPLGNFITDAMRIVAQKITGQRVDIAGQASGNIRKSIFTGTMEYSAGNISLYEILEATSIGHGLDGYPGCPIVSVYFTGEELRHLLEVNILAHRFLGDSSFLQSSGLRYSYNPANAALLTIPFINLPIPTLHAVTRAELYTGDGIQPMHSEGYVPLKRGDQHLYHLVTDGYVLLCLPLVKDILPQIEIVPKNAEGEPIPPERFDELIVHESDGTELKVWEAVVRYAASQLSGPDGIPRIPDYYRDIAGRITETWTFPLLGWVILVLAVIVAGPVFLVFRLRRRKRALSLRTQ
jgi:2',3'-cyclic-nucleotide 2'-phosphodiesterase (5'-nucleotidase family)